MGNDRVVSKETYVSDLKRYEASAAANAPSWVRDIRKTAIKRFQEQGFPTTKNEDWRFTRVRPLLQHDFKWLAEPSHNGFDAEGLSRFSFPDSARRQLVFLNEYEVDDGDAAIRFLTQPPREVVQPPNQCMHMPDPTYQGTNPQGV